LEIFQKITNGAPLSQSDLWVCITAPIGLTTILRKFTVQPDIQKNIDHLASSDRWKDPNLVTLLELPIMLLDDSIHESDPSLFRWDFQFID
jgi:hypothetical protein